MNEREFIEKIKRLNISVLTLSDIVRIIQKDRNYAAVFMKRLQDRGVVDRAEKGKYILTDIDPLVVATNLILPSYVSFLSGLAYYHKTTQIPVTIQIATTVSKKNVDYKGTRITFVHLNETRMFGFKKEKIGTGYVFIGELEKIIVDCLFLPRYCPLSETKDAFETVDVQKIVEYAKQMDSIVTLKRLGYLLELNGMHIYETMKNHFNNRLDLLNPLLPASGENNKRWMLKINEVF
jgi:predicted transcriptional regulator of viral defense system